jgi:hypothetical protein
MGAIQMTLTLKKRQIFAGMLSFVPILNTYQLWRASTEGLAQLFGLVFFLDLFRVEAEKVRGTYEFLLGWEMLLQGEIRSLIGLKHRS